MYSESPAPDLNIEPSRQDRQRFGLARFIERRAHFRILSASEPVIVFHHMPKCAGVSTCGTLFRWFALVYDYDSAYRSRTQFDQCPVDLRYLNASVILAGHWNTDGSFLHQRYPQLRNHPNLFRFTFLRDPLEVAISHYFYFKRNSPNEAGADPNFAALRTYLASHRGFFCSQFPCSESDYEAVLDRYAVIGLAESMNTSFRLLHASLMNFLAGSPYSKMARRALAFLANRPVADLPFRNVTERNDEISTITAGDREEFRNHNALDYRIFESASRRFQESCAAYGIDPQPHAACAPAA